MNGHLTGTVTFLFTNIEGSTKLAREYAEMWDSSRARHHAIFSCAIHTSNSLREKELGP